MKTSTGDMHKLKAAVASSGGVWTEAMEGMLAISPEFLEAYVELRSTPWRTGSLPPKVKEFVHIAVNASVTHMQGEEIRLHIRNALQHRASGKEIMEVLQLTSVLGMHSLTMGMPALIEEFEAAAKGTEFSIPFDLRRQELKQKFEEVRGYWNDFWNGLLALSPEFFESYLAFSGIPWTQGVLEPKVKEFIYIAIDVATTHLYEPGLRIHIQNAIRYGATPFEIMEIYQLAADMGMQTCTLSVPILLQEMQRAGVSE